MKSKLMLGSGANTRKDYINLDIVRCEGVDVIHDFNEFPFPFKDNAFKEILIPDSIHCVDNLFRFMEEVWRISKPDATIKLYCVHFLSPIHCQDPYHRTRVGYNTFDVFTEEHEEERGVSYDTTAQFKIVKRKWVFSKNNKLRWLSFLPNIFPTFYARFLYFYFPCNSIEFELRTIKC